MLFQHSWIVNTCIRHQHQIFTLEKCKDLASESRLFHSTPLFLSTKATCFVFWVHIISMWIKCLCEHTEREREWKKATYLSKLERIMLHFSWCELFEVVGVFMNLLDSSTSLPLSFATLYFFFFWFSHFHCSLLSVPKLVRNGNFRL